VISSWLVAPASERQPARQFSEAFTVYA